MWFFALAPLGAKFGMHEWIEDQSIPPYQISHPSVQNAPQRHIPSHRWRDFHEICRVCTSFHDVLAVKIWMYSLKELQRYGGFKMKGMGSPKFLMPPMVKQVAR